MSTDNPATLGAAASGNRRGQSGRAADVIATIVLLVVHGFLFMATMTLLGLLVMATDSCGYQACGDPAWIDRAIELGFWAGIAIFIVSLGFTIFRLVRQRVAFFVPLIGCVAQLGLAIGAAAMEWQAGPG
jgi:hypothetical protein